MSAVALEGPALEQALADDAAQKVAQQQSKPMPLNMAVGQLEAQQIVLGKGTAVNLLRTAYAMAETMAAAGPGKAGQIKGDLKILDDLLQAAKLADDLGDRVLARVEPMPPPPVTPATKPE